MKNASYCVSYGKEGRLQQNEQKNSFCYSPLLALLRLISRVYCGKAASESEQTVHEERP